MRPGPEFFRIAGHFENGPTGPALDAYLDPLGIPTIGTGAIRMLDGSPVKMGDRITIEEAFQLAERDAEDAAREVRKIKRPLNQYQFDALCSFVYNLGGANLHNSTQLLPAVEAGRWEDAAESLGAFVRGWGKKQGKWHRLAMLGLLIRRYAEGCLMLGLDWQDVCTRDNIGLPRRTVWDESGATPSGEVGRYFDEIQDGKTEFTTIEAMARSTPLPPLASPNTPASLTTKADPAAVPATVKAEQPVPTIPVPGPAVSASPKPSAPVSPSGSVGPAPSIGAPPPKAAPVPVLPAPKPKLPDPPVPIGQQTSAVDGARRSEEWSANTKAMWQSRRFYGLMLIFAGRIWMLKTGSSAFLGAVSDPLVMEFVGGFGVMIAGELIQMWGQRKATKALR